jgi:hypothetical protein
MTRVQIPRFSGPLPISQLDGVRYHDATVPGDQMIEGDDVMAPVFTPVPRALQESGHPCSNCDRPTLPTVSTAATTLYSCPICGQREQVVEQGRAGHRVCVLQVLQAPNVILGEC